MCHLAHKLLVVYAFSTATLHSLAAFFYLIGCFALLSGSLCTMRNCNHQIGRNNENGLCPSAICALLGRSHLHYRFHAFARCGTHLLECGVVECANCTFSIRQKHKQWHGARHSVIGDMHRYSTHGHGGPCTEHIMYTWMKSLHINKVCGHLSNISNLSHL